MQKVRRKETDGNQRCENDQLQTAAYRQRLLQVAGSLGTNSDGDDGVDVLPVSRNVILSTSRKQL
jgi:hypothetical protein